MDFDYKTIMMYFSGSIFITVLLFLFYLFTGRQRSWPIVTYIIGKTTQLIAVIGIILRDSIPDGLSIHFSLILLIASYSFEILSIISYDGKLRKNVLTFLIVLFIATILFFLYFDYNPAYRSAVSSFSATLIFGVGGIDLFIFRKKFKFPVLIGLVFIVYATIQLIRGIVLLRIAENYQLYEVSPIDTMFYIAAFIYLSLSSIGFLLMLKEKDEELIFQKNKILEVTTQNKNKLFSIIAHDLKSPIGAMASIGQILLEQHKELTNDQREEVIDNITQSSKETYNLLNNLLEWTQSETVGIEYKPESVNVNLLVKENTEILKYAFKHKNIILELNLQEGAIVFADINMINTIIRNLLSNAIKFTNSEGKVSVTTNTNSDNTTSIHISDNGIGIDSHTFDNLFNLITEHNFRGTDNESGTGLGLKLCKEFIEKNKGEILVESEIKKGSTFTIVLPTGKISNA